MIALALLLGCAAIGDDSPHATRKASAERVYSQQLTMLEMGEAKVEDVCRWSVRWYEAERDAKEAGALQRHLHRLEGLMSVTETRSQQGTSRPIDLEVVRNYVAEARSSK